MNRTIKFRAWYEHPEKMVYNDPNWWMPANFNPNDETTHIMQFTGLTDRNGKEIYEEDVLRIYDKQKIKADFLARVIWLKDELAFGFKKGLGWQRPSESIWPWIIDSEVEVIGNIYENPNLLK